MKKKPANTRGNYQRRRQREHALEVTARQSMERSRRKRIAFFTVCKFVFWVGLIVGAVVGGKAALRRFVWQNPDYALAEIIYRTDGTLLREDALTTARLVEGVNIFKVDISGARARIAAMPQVDRVEVRRLFPNRVNVTVSERKPIAWVMKTGTEDPTASKKAFLIDARAIPMKPRNVLHQYLSLPIISGFPVENLADGQRAANYEIQAALELVRLNADDTRWQIKTIDVANGYSLVVTDSRHIQVTFHLDNLERQIERLHKLFGVIGVEKQKELQRVNLYGEKNTYVKFAPLEEAEIAPVAPPMPPAKPGSKTPPKSTPPKATPAPRTATPAPRPATSPTPSSTIRKPSPVDHLKKPFKPNG